jgi:hypothetical protein
MYICIAQYQAQRCTLQSWKKKRKKMFFHLLFFSIQFSYVSQVFLTRCHSTKREKRQSTNYRQSYFFLLLLLFTVIKHSERNCLLLFLSRLEMARKWDKKLRNRREYLVSFHSNPEKPPQKKCRHINSDDGAMLEEEMIVVLQPLFLCVEKKDKRQHWNCV